MKKEKQIRYTFFQKKRVLLTAGFLVGILQLVLFIIYKKQGGIFLETLRDFELFFKRLLVDRLLIEALSIVILFYLTVRFQNYLAKGYPNSLKEILQSNFRYLPVLLLSLLIFIPVAILLRHFWRNDLAFEGERLIRNFKHFKRMYLEALLPFSVVGYTFFNLNLFLQLSTKKVAKNKKKDIVRSDTSDNGNYLEVINDNGNILIPISQMLWIEKKDRTYEVKTAEKLYHIRKTLNELEVLLLPKGFIRINRSVIVHREYVHNYSFWEYDKFILRMKDEALTEFIVSRERMRQIKNQLTQVTKTDNSVN